MSKIDHQLQWETDLVHVVPDMCILRALRPGKPSLDSFSFEQASPPIPCSRVEEINP